ncbi:hypothetical protein [Pedobacter sp. CFBP9032]|uniref:hypothetical protein n=1 Tax=Pedobacter sp. CFBP9032 TaxID=3096539 RepID=UPI002A6B2DB8|nr:hypothetical protein [Pedobacter sp. CFBP9032]MDY0904501.1 hypothetical protein [Pedobacter sp. CFBP9032]
MKNILLLSVLVLCLITIATAQSRQDTLEVYKKILKTVDLPKSKISVKSLTDRNLFNNIHLANPSYNTLDTTSTKFWHKKDWTDFLTKIDTSNLKNYALKINNKKWFGTTKKATKSRIIVTFSPIIFNNSNDKAICILNYFSNGSGGAIISAFFEKSDNVWGLHETLLLTLFD